jgi:pilus assembly protein Flp/PilA
MRSFPARFVTNESGVTALEYGLIAALVVIVIIGAVSTLGPSLIPAFQTIASALTGA